MTVSRRQIAWFALGAALAGVVLALVFAVFTSASKSTEIRDSQQKNSPLINKTNRAVQNTNKALRIVQGCTTPGERCYERAQRQTADAVSNINRVVIIAAACASEPGTHSVEEIQACVIARLADEP